MTYPVLAAALLAVAAAAGWLLTRPAAPRGHARAVLATAAVLVVLTAAADSAMIAAGLFRYADEHLLGPRIGLAPVEDFSYPLATAMALPALWVWLGRRRAGRRSTPLGPPPGAPGLLRHLVVSSRPVSWINTAYPFAAAYLITAREVDALLVLGAVYFLVPYNLALYGINDVFDYASDAANPRKGGAHGALLPPATHRAVLVVAAATNVPLLVVLFAVGPPAARVVLAVSIAALLAYSVPRLRFKEVPLLDSVTSSLHFVTPAAFGLALAGGAVTRDTAAVLGAFFLWGCASHAFGAVQDIVPDRRAGIASVATWAGAARTVRLALALWTAAGLLMLTVSWPGPLAALLAVPYLVNCAPYRRCRDEDAATTTRAWRRFLVLNYAVGFLVTLLLVAAWRTAA